MIKKYGGRINLALCSRDSCYSANECSLYEFGSLGEFLKFLNETPIHTNRELGSHKTGWSRKKFTGTETYEEAFSLLEKGWEEGASKIEKGLKEVLKNSSSTSTRQKSVYDVIGGNASVPRYLQGVPTNMIRQIRKPIKERIMDINIDVCFSSGTTTSEMIDNCINQLQKAVNFENSGVRTNIYVCRISVDYDVAHMIRIKVKNSTERLNVLKLAFLCAHPSMLRRILFAYDEKCPELPEEWCTGYGKAVKLDMLIDGVTNIDKFLETATHRKEVI